MRTIVFDDDGPHDLGDLDVGQVHNVIAAAVGEQPAKATELEFLNDMMACVSDLLKKLAAGTPDETPGQRAARQRYLYVGLKGMKDGLSERIGDLEEGT